MAQSNIEQGFPNITHGATQFLHRSTSAMLRGGRITKFKGEAASFSPELGLVAVGAGRGDAAGGGAGGLTHCLIRRLLRWSVAPIALLAGTSPAFAQDACVEVTPGQFVCEDNGAPATVQQEINLIGVDVVVTLEDGFEVDVANYSGGYDGIDIDGAASVVITQSGGTSTIVGSRGIDVYDIEGDISITTGGDVTGRDNDGIYAGNLTSGSVSIDSRAGTVKGGGAGNGIQAENFGDGDLTILSANVSTTGDDGINAKNYGGNLRIDSTAGLVTGAREGIDAGNYGTGALTITARDVTGSSRDGITATNEGTDLIIDSSAGAVVGGSDGIDARNSGTGALSITTADVTGSGDDGIFATNYGTDLIIDSSAGAVVGRSCLGSGRNCLAA